MKIYGELESLSLLDAEPDEPPSPEDPDDGEDDSDDDSDDEDCDDVESEPVVEFDDDPDCLLCVPTAGGVPIGVSRRSGWPKSVPEPAWRRRVEFDDVEDDEDVDDSVFVRRSARGGLELLPSLDDVDSDALRRSARGGSPLSLLLDDDEDDEDGRA